MSGPSGEGGLAALGSRLAELKRWAARDADISVHSAVCVVNGKAKDVTRKAPVLMYENTRPGWLADGTLIGQGPRDGAGRRRDREWEDPHTAPRTRGFTTRFIGCQVSTVLDFKKDDLPSSAMVTYCRRGRRQTAPWRGVTALRTG